LYARKTLGLRPAPEFEEWLARMDILEQKDGQLRLGKSVPPLFGKALGRLG
jgi:ethanolamine ammonia-lyase large subunit